MRHALALRLGHQQSGLAAAPQNILGRLRPFPLDEIADLPLGQAGAKVLAQVAIAKLRKRSVHSLPPLRIVHRLDKETSGLLLIAKKRSALVALQDQLRQRETGKTYAALVIGAWPARRKVIDVALHKTLTAGGERRVHAVEEDHEDGRRSITLVKIAQQFGAFTLLDVTIKTGRTHQIRVHLTHEGHAIVGDEKYGDFTLNKAVARGAAVPGCRFDRMFLHAKTLRFTHPGSNEVIELTAPLPAECEALIHALAQTAHP